MLVIPAIDLLDGKVVRLKKGQYQEVTVYNDHPLSEARKFKEAGFSHIHIIDLNGAREGTFVNLDIIREIVGQTGLSVQTGGGIRSYDDAQRLFRAGIERVICSSMAVKKPGEWLALVEEGPEKVILGMDLKEGKMAYGGWLKTSEQSIEDFLKPMRERGLKQVLCTDIARDGMLSGPNLQLYESLMKKFPDLDFIASGGVSKAGDLEELRDRSLFGVVVGKAYYENRLSLEEMIACHRPSEKTSSENHR